MSGFASGLLAGMQTARGWVDTYNGVRNTIDQQELRQDLQGIKNAQVETNTQFSPQQGMRLSNLADQGANVQYDPALGGYMATQGAPVDGMGPAQSQEFIAPQKDYSFLGKNYSSMPNPEEVNLARRSAMADRVGINNPELGLRLQGQASKQFEADTAIAEKHRAKELDDYANDYFKDLSTEDIVGQLGGVINPSEMPGMLNYDSKTGGATMIYSLGDKTYTANLTPAQIKDYARQALIAGKGNMANGVPSLVNSLQTAQSTDAKGRKTALDMQNVQGQIDDRVSGRKIQQQTADQAGEYQRMMGAVAQTNAGTSRLNARTAQTNALTNVAKADATVERQGQYNPERDVQLKAAERMLTEQVKAGQMSVEEAQAKLGQIEQARRVDFGVQRSGRALAQQIKSGKTTVEGAIEEMTQSGVPPQAMEAILKAAGVASQAKPAPQKEAPSGAMKLPSGGAKSAPQGKPAPADVTGKLSAINKESTAAWSKSKAEEAARQKAIDDKREAEYAESRRKIAQSLYDTYGKK